MPRRLLILSDAITAPSYSPRLISLIRHLTDKGWQCTLATDNIAGQSFRTDLCPQVSMTYIPEHTNTFVRVCKRLADKLFNARERQFTAMLTSSFKASDFDLIFCSTYYYFPLYTAEKLSRRWNIPFVTDVRDIAEQWGKTPYFTTALPRLFGLERFSGKVYEKRCIRFRDRILRRASAVTTVSEWHRDLLQSRTAAPVSCIFNGYDPQEITPAETKAPHFALTFIGRFINMRLRQPQLLFQAAGELLAERLISASDLHLDFYCEPKYAGALTGMADEHRAAQCLKIHPYIPRTEIGSVMARSSVILAFGAPSSEHQHGILGTKVFEAIGMEKPFMLIPSDEDELARLIASTGIGTATSSVSEIKDFILAKYREWQANGFTRQAVRDRQRFSREKECGQFEAVFDSILSAEGTGIVIPAYNAGQYIGQCLESLRRQSCKDWHAVVVDDGSTDNTAETVRHFAETDKRFTLLTYPSNRGQAAARNTALQYLLHNPEAGQKCRYICFIDADDYIDEDYLATMTGNIGNHDILQTGYRRLEQDGSTKRRYPSHFYQFTSPCMRLYDSRLLRNITFPEGMIYEDVVFSLKLWNLHPTHRMIRYAGYCYRRNPSSTTSRRDREAERTLFETIKATKAPLWLKAYTCMRLKLHFIRQKE